MSSVNMFDFDVIKDSLPVTENGVSFCDRGVKLNSVEDGKLIDCEFMRLVSVVSITHLNLRARGISRLARS